jgi:hypothetical protein
VGLKDRLFEKVAMPILNRTVLAPYGEARELRLDSIEKSAEILVALKGDADPVRVTVGRYELSEVGHDIFLTIQEIETSREWMTAVAERNLVGKAFRLPREFAGPLSKFV